MTRKSLFLLAAASLGLAAPNFALAAPGPGPAPWMSINQREAVLDARIDAGVRNRSLTQAEAASLRQQLTSLENLEASYRASRGGLDDSERADLDRRFDALSAGIHDQANDNQLGRSPFASREDSMSGRIDTGVRSGKLTPSEASDLRNRLEDIRRTERAAAVRGGLSPRERDDVSRRLDALANEIDRQIADADRRGPWNLPGWNGAPWMVGGRWQSIAQRQDDFNRIIDPGIRSGRISRTESVYLHNEFNRLLNLERRYMSGGLSANERDDLDRQFNTLVRRIRAEAMDNNNGRGTGPGPGNYR